MKLNKYCSKCLKTQSFIQKGKFIECPTCGKELLVVSHARIEPLAESRRPSKSRAA